MHADTGAELRFDLRIVASWIELGSRVLDPAQQGNCSPYAQGGKDAEVAFGSSLANGAEGAN